MSRPSLARAAASYARLAALADEAVALLAQAAALERLDAIFEEKRVLNMELSALGEEIVEGLRAMPGSDPTLLRFQRAQMDALAAEDLLCQTLKKLDKSKILSEHFDLKLKSKTSPGKHFDSAQ